MKEIIKWIEDNKDVIIDANDKIWSFAEASEEEYKSSAYLKETLSKHGFSIEENIAGLKTAFKARFSIGSGKPIIGFLGEYDALAGLSQKVSTKKEPVQEGAPGHGCGHNVLGAGVLGGVLGLKAYMQKESIEGTIVFVGCPAEETVLYKVNMAHAGAFDELDAALTWHPNVVTGVAGMSTLATHSLKFNFHGRSAHAAAGPENGRSALDAVELMNVGVNYLREHMPLSARIHYVTTNGGSMPNIVPDYSQSWYIIRSPEKKALDDLYKRVLKIAEGASLMTETKVQVERVSSCNNMIPNQTINNVLQESLLEVGPPVWDEEDIKFAKEISKTFPDGAKEATIKSFNLPQSFNEKYLFDMLCPKVIGIGTVLPASTDVGDVSWITPTAQFAVAHSPFGVPGHSWQTVASSGSSLSHKAAVVAAKTFAIAGLKLLQNLDILKVAKEELKIAKGGQEYVSPLNQF